MFSGTIIISFIKTLKCQHLEVLAFFKYSFKIFFGFAYVHSILNAYATQRNLSSKSTGTLKTILIALLKLLLV